MKNRVKEKKYSNIFKKNKNKIIIENHKHYGIFILRGKEDALCTINMTPGKSTYGEKRITIFHKKKNVKIEYRIWNPFRSKLAAAILGGIDDIFIKPGSNVLYIGAASGTTISHISDIIGNKGVVYAIEFSHRTGRDLIDMAKKRLNVVPIIEDARYPHKYRIFLDIVDVIFCDVAQPDQERILSINSQYFLKPNGYFIISIKASCIDSTVDASLVFAKEVQKLQKNNFYPIEQITLEPYERDHAFVLGKYGG